MCVASVMYREIILANIEVVLRVKLGADSGEVSLWLIKCGEHGILNGIDIVKALFK